MLFTYSVNFQLFQWTPAKLSVSSGFWEKYDRLVIVWLKINHLQVSSPEESGRILAQLLKRAPFLWKLQNKELKSLRMRMRVAKWATVI